MQTNVKLFRMYQLLFFSFIVSLSIITGCSIQLIAPYDADTQRSTFECAKLVDHFYGKLM